MQGGGQNWSGGGGGGGWGPHGGGAGGWGAQGGGGGGRGPPRVDSYRPGPGHGPPHGYDHLHHRPIHDRHHGPPPPHGHDMQQQRGPPPHEMDRNRSYGGQYDSHRPQNHSFAQGGVSKPFPAPGIHGLPPKPTAAPIPFGRDGGGAGAVRGKGWAVDGEGDRRGRGAGRDRVARKEDGPVNEGEEDGGAGDLPYD